MEFGIADLCDVNRLLFAIADLVDSTNTAESETVRFLCESKVFGGRKYNHTRSVELSSYLGFIARAASRLAITSLGRELVLKNPNGFYEITYQQKEFLAKTLIFEGKLRTQAELVFRLFLQDYQRETWSLDTIDRSLLKSFVWLAELMVGLGIIERQGTLLVVSPKYVLDVTRLNTPKAGLSSEELENILRAKKRLGDLGERLVEEYERARLLGLGRKAEASLVSRISEIDAAAGFDIKSFDGTEPAYDYDRLIEVKSSTKLDIRFNLSSNEYEMAQQYGNRYWIYFCAGVDPRAPRLRHLVMIQNPFRKLEELGFHVEPSEYVVYHMSELLARATVSSINNVNVLIL